MRCCVCKRGITYRRIERDSAMMVYRPGEGDNVYCGLCVHFDKADVQEGDVVTILLGDGEANFRGRRFIPSATT